MGKKLVVFLVAVVAIVSLVVVGCAPKAAPPPPEEGAPPPAEEEEAPPAVPEAKVIKWVGQSHAGGITQQHYSLVRTGEKIAAASGGRLQMTTEVGGGIAPATKEFDAADTGVLDFAVTCYMYWKDKFPAAGLFTMKSGGMSPMEALCWFWYGGGGELAEEMIKGYNVHIVRGGCGWMGTPENFLHTDKPLKTIGDLKGLKIRAAGDGGEILSRVGAGVVMMPAGEIFESMLRGVIDAYECSNPTLDWDLGLQDAGKYLYLSGCRQPYESNVFIVNQDRWNELPDDLKAIVEEVVREEAFDSYADVIKKDIVALQNFRDYGVIVEKLSPEFEEAWWKEADKYYAEKAAADPLTAKVLESYNDFQKSFREMWTRP